MPKVEFSGGEFVDGGKSMDPFEDSLEDALCVFKSGGGAADADILKENEAQLLFYVDLDNEQLVDRSVGQGGQTEDLDDEGAASESKHPVLLNQYPLCNGHSLFLLFA